MKLYVAITSFKFIVKIIFNQMLTNIQLKQISKQLNSFIVLTIRTSLNCNGKSQPGSRSKFQRFFEKIQASICFAAYKNSSTSEVKFVKQKTTKRCPLQNCVSLFSPCSLALQLQTPKSMILLQKTLKTKTRSPKLLQRLDAHVFVVLLINFLWFIYIYVNTYTCFFLNVSWTLFK